MKICNQPLGLPKGTVRAILAMGVIGGSLYALFKGIINADNFVMITGVIIAFYFTSRNKD